MGTKTGIAWTSATWNPIRGCSRVSAGCINCYAELMAGRFSGPGQPYHGLAHFIGEGEKREARWTGELAFVEGHLLDPVRWQKPRMIFVNSMSDLFHEKVPDEWLDRIFAVMAATPRHIFQVLTKRPERMASYLSASTTPGRIWPLVTGLTGNGDLPWPLPNVWMGVSVENQQTADERIHCLFGMPAAVRWVSYEPALDIVDWSDWADLLDWIVVGGESTQNKAARHFDPHWAREALRQCFGTKTRVFIKQMGSNAFTTAGTRPEGEQFNWADLKGPGKDPEQWPADLRIREYPA